MRVVELLVQNLRSFYGVNLLEIRPLTFLVGENSSGKSTLLAALSACGSEVQFTLPFRARLNQPPFSLGRFEDMTTYRGGRAPQESFFKIGARLSYKCADGSAVVGARLFTYVNVDGVPTLQDATLHVPPIIVRISHSAGSSVEIASALVKDFRPRALRELVEPAVMSCTVGQPTHVEFPMSALQDNPSSVLIGFMLSDILQKRLEGEAAKAAQQGLTRMYEMLFAREDVYSLAPIRATPERTYESHTEHTSPEGHHVPFLIERETRTPQASSLQQALVGFGRSSDLFGGISVRRFGKPKGSRFAVNVKVNGPVRNVKDVGYGVAQALPPVVECVRLPEYSTVMLQQPEVHLHPRAQAALGSLFCTIVAEHKKTLLVETHSDYIIDRVRREVARGVLAASDVLVWFLELRGTTTVLHRIEVDKNGSFVKQPSAYRRFFEEETLSILEK